MRRHIALSPRWRKVWMDLWGNRLRTLLVMLSISVGVFAVGMVYSSYLMFERDLSRSWGASEPASASLYADPFDEELVDSVRSLRGVKEAEGRRNVTVRVRMGDGQWKQIMLIAIPDYIKQRVNIVRPLSGDWPPDDGDVLLERSSQKEMGVVTGERITVETTAGRKRSLKVSGLVYDPTQIPTLFSGSYYGYISMGTLEKLDETRKSQLLQAMPGLKERAKTLIELADGAKFLFATRPLSFDDKAKALLDEAGRGHLAALLPRLAALYAGRGIELFSAQQISDIHESSGGWPGIINQVARDAMIEAMIASRSAVKRPSMGFKMPKKHVLT